MVQKLDWKINQDALFFFKQICWFLSQPHVFCGQVRLMILNAWGLETQIILHSRVQTEVSWYMLVGRLSYGCRAAGKTNWDTDVGRNIKRGKGARRKSRWNIGHERRHRMRSYRLGESYGREGTSGLDAEKHRKYQYVRLAEQDDGFSNCLFNHLKNREISIEPCAHMH